MNNTFLDEEEGIIELEDEDGNVTRFEFVDAMEYNGTTYYALVPESDDEDSVDEFVVLKEEEVNGQAMLATVDDDEEYASVGEMFLQRFSEFAGYDDEDEAEDEE